MAVRATISLAVTAHELSFTFTLSSLHHAHVLINIGGIDIYCLRMENVYNVSRSLVFPFAPREQSDYLPVPWVVDADGCEDAAWCGALSNRGRAISTSLEKCFKHVKAVALSESHSIVCCLFNKRKKGKHFTH